METGIHLIEQYRAAAPGQARPAVPMLGEHTWPQVPTGQLLVVPVGSMEQHGPHLPLDADTRIAAALAEQLVADHGAAVLAPAVPYGASGEHQDFPGTVSVGRHGVHLYLLELVRSVSATFPRILLVNGHGGNHEVLVRVVTRLRREGRDARLWTVTVPGGDGHAGRTETSILLALCPHLVRLERAQAGRAKPLSELMPLLRREGVRAVAPNGVIGDPTGASAKEGRRLLAEMSARLRMAAAAWFG